MKWPSPSSLKESMAMAPSGTARSPSPPREAAASSTAVAPADDGIRGERDWRPTSTAQTQPGADAAGRHRSNKHDPNQPQPQRQQPQARLSSVANPDDGDTDDEDVDDVSIVESLRHDLFLALQMDDGDGAYTVYTTTREDWLRARREERERRLRDEEAGERLRSMGGVGAAIGVGGAGVPGFGGGAGTGGGGGGGGGLQRVASLGVVEGKAKAKEKLDRLENAVGSFWRSTKATLKVADELQKKPEVQGRGQQQQGARNQEQHKQQQQQQPQCKEDDPDVMVSASFSSAEEDSFLCAPTKANTPPIVSACGGSCDDDTRIDNEAADIDQSLATGTEARASTPLASHVVSPDGGCSAAVTAAGKDISGVSTVDQRGLLEVHMSPSEFFPASYFTNLQLSLAKSGDTTTEVGSGNSSNADSPRSRLGININVNINAADTLAAIISEKKRAKSSSPSTRNLLRRALSGGAEAEGGGGRAGDHTPVAMDPDSDSKDVGDSPRQGSLSVDVGTANRSISAEPLATGAASNSSPLSAPPRSPSEGGQSPTAASSEGSGAAAAASGGGRKTSAAVPVAVTTTPLHEAARIGHPRLLRRMLAADALGDAGTNEVARVDLSLRDWKNRTLWHHLCGGITRSELGCIERGGNNQKKTEVEARGSVSGSEGDAEGVVTGGAHHGAMGSSLDVLAGGSERDNSKSRRTTAQVGIPSFYYCAMEQKRQKERAAEAALAARALKSPKEFFRNVLNSTTADGKAKYASLVASFKDKVKQHGGGSGGGDDSSAKSASVANGHVGDKERLASAGGLSVPPGEWEAAQPRDSVATDAAVALVNGHENDDGDGTGHSFLPSLCELRQNVELVEKQRRDRMECIQSVFAIGEEPSLNSVDSRNRTALHYGAELGRYDVARALLLHPGGRIMVTIVDDSGLTACELASMGGHKKVAALLEAWALFEKDDDVEHLQRDDGQGPHQGEASAARQQRYQHHGLVPPFAWYRTFSMDAENWKADCRLEKERRERIESARSLLSKFLLDRPSSDPSVNTDTQGGEDHGCTGQIANAKHRGGSCSDLDSSCSENSKDIKCDEIVVSQGLERDGDENDQFVIPPDYQWTNAQMSALLDAYGWNVSNMIDGVQTNPKKILVEDIKVFNIGVPLSTSDTGVNSVEKSAASNFCLICCDEFSTSDPEWIVLEKCRHGFCSSCLSDYISTSYVNKSTRSAVARGLRVICPHHKCPSVLEESEVAKLLASPKDLSALLYAENEAFVSSASAFKFCPHPGCHGVVQRCTPPFLAENFDDECINAVGATCTEVLSASSDQQLKYQTDSNNGAVPKTYEGVLDMTYEHFISDRNPYMAHRFCFACGAISHHWPATCDMMEMWRDKIGEEIGSILGKSSEKDKAGAVAGEGSPEAFEDIAHRLWIKANTRPCPKCKAPIEKNDGCNHMTCTNRHCRHEFCWICRKDWSLHNTRTGGYFRCNRWQEDEDVDEFVDRDSLSEENGRNYGTSMHSARMARRKAKAMARFIHHYSRWTAHRESAALERNMATTVSSRLAPVVLAAMEFVNGEIDMGNKGLSFVHAAFIELLECRSFLQHSYAFAFFRYPKFSSKTTSYRIRSSRQAEKVTFEALQSELEILTEHMSDIVARSHLRASRSQIVFLTSAAAEKRRELTNQIVAIHHEEKRVEKMNKEISGGDATENEYGNDTTGSEVAAPVGETPEQQPMEDDLSVELFSEVLGRFVRLGRGEENVNLDEGDGGQENVDAADIEPNEAGTEDVNEETDGPLTDDQLEFLDEAEEAQVRRAVEASIRSQIALSQSFDSEDDEDISGDNILSEWSCAACTYHNVGNRCAMCGTRRGS